MSSQTEGMEVGTNGKGRIYCLRYGRGVSKTLNADYKLLENLGEELSWLSYKMSSTGTCLPHPYPLFDLTLLKLPEFSQISEDQGPRTEVAEVTWSVQLAEEETS